MAERRLSAARRTGSSAALTSAGDGDIQSARSHGCTGSGAPSNHASAAAISSPGLTSSMRDAGRDRRLAGKTLAVEQRRHRRRDAGETRQPLRAAGARQQANQRFRQADGGAPVVGQHAIVRGERQLAAAAERQTGDGRGDRLAAGFQRAQRETQAEEVVVGGREIDAALASRESCRRRPRSPAGRRRRRSRSACRSG